MHLALSPCNRPSFIDTFILCISSHFPLFHSTRELQFISYKRTKLIQRPEVNWNLFYWLIADLDSAGVSYNVSCERTCESVPPSAWIIHGPCLEITIGVAAGLLSPLKAKIGYFQRGIATTSQIFPSNNHPCCPVLIMDERQSRGKGAEPSRVIWGGGREACSPSTRWTLFIAPQHAARSAVLNRFITYYGLCKAYLLHLYTQYAVRETLEFKRIWGVGGWTTTLKQVWCH